MARLLLLFTLGCTAAPAERQQPIVGGSRDDGDPAVVLIEHDSFKFMPGVQISEAQLCSGSLISPTVVLTAGHCTIGAEQAHASLEVQTGTELYHPDEVVAGLPHTHPAYNPTTIANDVAVVVLQRPFCKTPPLLPINRAPLDASSLGSTLRLVGFGITAADDTQPAVKRTTQVAVSEVDATIILDQDVDHSICQGDSGGPALLRLNGVETIAGVASRVESGCHGKGIFQRVDAVADFLQPYLDAPPSPAPYDCASGGCSATPGSPNGILVLLALLVLSRRASRSGRAARRSTAQS